ncbi:hypothetical protein H3S74_00185 [Gilliamella sp. W8126]|uniref:hypothetical protein n=1 Tax=Gilliamella sp. W8126 TaxID=2750946 RepID=UPI0018DBFCC0|nr:hypothetical protein [Gilliamella sp. W8126]MBI0004652.1 hypothetical protein [Gilliamella sp. W8126]
MANRDVWQGCVLLGTNTVDALKQTMAEGRHIVTTCVVAVGVGKEGSHKPSLLGRNRRIELITKQQNVRNSKNKKI